MYKKVFFEGFLEGAAEAHNNIIVVQMYGKICLWEVF